MRIKEPVYNEITYTQVQWIIQALNHQLGDIRDEMDRAPDGSPVQSLGEIALEGRTALVNKLNDIVNAGYKTIRIV